MRRSVILIILFFAAVHVGLSQQNEHVRYVLIEAPCKAGFQQFTNQKDNVILSKVFKVEFENAFEVVNAEPNLITDFEVALDQSFPNSRNQIKDILLYMLNSEKEAKELYKRKIKQFDTLGTGVIELKVR